jgi:hypothetical protein
MWQLSETAFLSHVWFIIFDSHVTVDIQFSLLTGTKHTVNQGLKNVVASGDQKMVVRTCHLRVSLWSSSSFTQLWPLKLWTEHSLYFKLKFSAIIICFICRCSGQTEWQEYILGSWMEVTATVRPLYPFLIQNICLTIRFSKTFPSMPLLSVKEQKRELTILLFPWGQII